MSATMLLLTFATLALVSLASGEKYKPIDIEIKTNPGGEPLKIFTTEELSNYDASDPKLPIYLGMRGVVFDVTSGKAFYSKESEYNKLVGKDASRAHALWSLDDKDLTHDLSGLSDDELRGLDQVFEGTYMAKYPVVGYMDWFISEQGDTIMKRFLNEEL